MISGLSSFGCEDVTVISPFSISVWKAAAGSCVIELSSVRRRTTCVCPQLRMSHRRPSQLTSLPNLGSRIGVLLEDFDTTIGF